MSQGTPTRGNAACNQPKRKSGLTRPQTAELSDILCDREEQGELNTSPERANWITLLKLRQSVRTITADFGFSFALPTTAPAFPEQPIVEHPTKRQRTVGSPSSKPRKDHILKQTEEEKHSPQADIENKSTEDVVAQVAILPTQELRQEVKATLVETPTLDRPVKNYEHSEATAKPRRKLKLDDELEILPTPKENAPQSEDSEDTFIFGLKPKRRQPKSKLKETIEEEGPTHEEIESAPVPSKRRRTAKAKQKANVEICEKSAEKLDEKEVGFEANPKKSKGKQTSRECIDALHIKMNPPEEAPAPITTGVDEAKELCLQNPHVETIKSQSVPKATKSKATESKATAKKVAKRTMDEFAENDTDTATEPTTMRPRRQAAISATARVALGYEEELVPADKLRRAPEPVAKRGRPKKTTVPEHVPVLPPSPPQSTSKAPVAKIKACEEDEVAVSNARPVKRGRKPGTKIAKVDGLATEKEPAAGDCRLTVKPATLEDLHNEPATARPAKKAHKARAQVLAQVSSTGEDPGTADQVSDKEENHEVSQKRSRALKTPALTTSRKSTSKATRRATKSVDITDEKPAVVEPVSEPPEVVIPETQESHDMTNNYDLLAVNQTKGSRSGRSGEEKTKSRRVLAESDVNIVRCLPPDDFESTVKPTRKDNDTDYARKKQSSRKTKLTPAINPTIEHDGMKHGIGADPTPNSSVELIHTKRTRKAQPARPTPAIEPSDGEPVTARKRHVTAADEDLDWLFEKCENKRSRIPTGEPCVSSKAKRQAPVKKSADAKDMDLDDLLESIAGFSGKLLTGKSGRAMASKVV